MIGPDLSSRTVLVTGGTRGLGLAIGLALGRCGASVWLTHRWGSEDESAIVRRFLDSGAPCPVIVEADVSNLDETERLFERMANHMERLDVFVSNASVVSRGGSVDSLRLRDLRRTLEYSLWPTASYVEEGLRRFGSPPRYVVATSSDGPDRHYPGYDYVALAKAGLEALCRKLARLSPSSKVFVLRTRQIGTGSYRDVFDDAARDAVAPYSRFELRSEEVGAVAVAIASGLLDGLSGPRAAVLTIDRGASFVDNVMSAGTLLERAERVS
jgi:enoyl-[acyl-carrier protein] reductase III